MKSRNEIISTLKSLKQEITTRFHVQKMAIFGSYARNEQTEKSDVDILVEVPPSIGLDFVTLAEKLEEALGMHVDLVSKRAVKENRWSIIEPDLIYV